jgi:hypothetical protein
VHTAPLGSATEHLVATSNSAAADVMNCATVRSAWVGPDLGSPEKLAALHTWLTLPKAYTDEAVATNRQTPKPAFLMMAYKKIVFEQAWESFFRNGGSGTSLLVVHVKESSAKVPSFFEPYVMSEDVETNRCHDTQLMLRMLELALADSAVTHFAFISGDTLPVGPLGKVIGDLSEDARTRFCVDPEWQRAETWFVINRPHASLIIEHLPELMNLVSSSDCEDEDRFYWPLAVRKESIADACVMMTDWSSTNKFWRLNSERCNCPKFLASAKDSGDCSRPALYKDVSPEGLTDLIESSANYWFARKFFGDGVDGNTTFNVTLSLDEEMARRITELSKPYFARSNGVGLIQLGAPSRAR